MPRDAGGRKEREEQTTAGSTKAVLSSPPSNIARTKEIAAEASSIITSWSLNCSSTSCHNGVGGSCGSATIPERNNVSAPGKAERGISAGFGSHHSFHTLLAQL